MKRSYYYLMVLFPIFIILFISITIFILSNKKFTKITTSYKNYIYNDFLRDNKKEVNDKVNFINSIINFENKQTEKILKTEIQEMLNITYQIVDDLYKKNKDILSIDQIRKKAIENISYVRFNKGRGYFYVIDYSKKIMLSHPLKFFQGRDLSETSRPGKNRFEILKDSLKPGNRYGFSKINVYKPNDTKNEYSKISGVYYYKPLDIMVGTGEYLDVIENRLKKVVLREIALLNQSKKTKNIAIYEYDKKTDKVKCLIDYEKLHKKCDLRVYPQEHESIMKKIILNADKIDSGFLEYISTNPETLKKSTKYIYFIYHKKWKWLVVSGFYLDEMNSISTLQEKVNSDQYKMFRSSLIVIASIILVVLLISYFILNKYKNILLTYTKEINNKKDELELIFSTTKDGIAILDLSCKFLYLNDAYCKIIGYKRDEIIDMSCMEITLPKDVKRVKEALLITKEKGFLENFEKTYISKKNTYVAVNMSLSLMPDKQRLLVAIKDITESKKRDKEIDNYISLIDKYIITSSTDLEGNINQVSEAFAKVSGYTKEELIGKKHSILKHPDMPNAFYKNLWKSILANEVWSGEIKNRKKDGGYYWVYATITPTFDDYGHKIGYTAIRQDITNRKIIEEISITDALTNIYNRRHFQNLIPKIINSAKRNNELLSFIIMDVDHFKQYNDTFGHQEGDEVLKKVAKTLKYSLNRADDFCFRLGGEEFGIVFKSESVENAIKFANIIKQNIEDLKIPHPKNTASKYLTVSMGLICEYASKIKDKDELYKLSDNLLYEAKESGRNKVCISTNKE